MSDIAEARELLDRALALGLSGAERYKDYPIETLAERWNGIGPERMKPEARKKLDKWLRLYKPGCFIHDQEFAESDGTFDGFVAANDRLEANCLIIAGATYTRWYDPRRYLARRGAVLVADACRLTGWSAWQDAYEERGVSSKGGPQTFTANTTTTTEALT